MESQSKKLFWGCFIALITTGFAFVGRLELLGVWGAEFGLDKQQAGILAGIGITVYYSIHTREAWLTGATDDIIMNMK